MTHLNALITRRALPASTKMHRYHSAFSRHPWPVILISAHPRYSAPSPVAQTHVLIARKKLWKKKKAVFCACL